MKEKKVTAFDIDGALTEAGHVQMFKELQNKRNHSVGIITARPRVEMQRFVEETNLQPDFAHSVGLKGIKMMDIEEQMPADQYKYYGSWFRDRIHATVSGWEYEQL